MVLGNQIGQREERDKKALVSLHPWILPRNSLKKEERDPG